MHPIHFEEMSEKLYREEGFHYITNLDFSGVCIEQMRERHAELEEMDYVDMDLTQPLDILDSDSFTMVLDKATFDCIACSDQYGTKAKQTLDNIYRILAPGGSYICVSHGRPETRLGYFQGYKWTVETQKVPKKQLEVLERIEQESFHYVYVCTKNF